MKRRVAKAAIVGIAGIAGLGLVLSFYPLMTIYEWAGDMGEDFG